MWLGLVLGLMIPFVGYALLLIGYEQLDEMGITNNKTLSEDFRERTIGLLAISFNLIPFAIYNAKRHINTMRGLVFPTMIFVVIWFVKFGLHLIY